MKIRALGKIGSINEGDIVEALINKSLDTVAVFDKDLQDTVWMFFRDKYPQFEIVHEPETEKPISELQTSRSFTLDELKQLKELFK